MTRTVGRLTPDPEDEHTFETKYGAFTLQRASLWHQREIHKEAARSLEGITNMDTTGEWLNVQMATIVVCARADDQKPTESPRGWPTGFNWRLAKDIDFLTTLYNAYAEWNGSFRDGQERTGETEGRSADAGKEQGVPPAESVRLGAE